MTLVLRIWLSTLFFLTGQFALAAENPTYYQITAQPGDGVYALMRRYKLENYSCNFSQFYKLNTLKQNAPLVQGRQYLLPILVYKFDGKSIRTTTGIKDWDQAVRIQTYNRELEKSGMREAPYEKNKILWVPHHELHCPVADRNIAAPATAKAGDDPGEQTAATMNVSMLKGAGANLATSKGAERTFPIFGEKYAYTPLVSKKLEGHVFYIDSGHGGPDPGAIGKRGSHRLCEDEYAYDVSLRLCRNLIAHGATVYMITRDPDDGIRSDAFLRCDYDEVVWGGEKILRAQKARLFQRSDIINTLYETNKARGVPDSKQKSISIHVDSRSRSQQVDLFFYHYPGNEEGHKLASKLHRTIQAKYKRYRKSGEYHGTVTGRDLHMLRETKPTSVYIELGNIFHDRDQQRIIIESNRQYIADWLFEGLAAD